MIKKIIMWLLTAVFVIYAITFIPSLSCLLFLIAAVMVVPIEFIQNNIAFHIKKHIKIILIVFLVLIAFIISPMDEDEPTTDATEPTSTTVEQTKETKSEEASIEYHKEEAINRLFASYNENAEIQILPENVGTGTYANQARITSEDGLVITISTTNTDGIYIEMQHEASNNSGLEKFFRDFSIAINSELSKDVANEAWEEIESGDYTVYVPYYLEDIACSYSEQLLTDGTYRYYVRMTVESY